MQDLVVLDVERDGSSYLIYTKPVKPCQLKPLTEALYEHEPYRGVKVLGPVTGAFQTVAPARIIIDSTGCDDLSMVTLHPFAFLYKEQRVISLGSLLKLC